MSKTININNGTGTGELINTSYSVTADINGYDNSSINPSTLNVEEGINSYTFTIEATGTLTLHVTEDGTTTGTPVVGATFYRTDSSGTQYGTAIVTDSSGNAVFNNVPYATSNAPTIYYKQTTSDGSHEFDQSVQSTTMTSSTSTVEIQNSVGATRTITLNDANYDNLPIVSGTLTLTN